jgi:hypothetical protein
MEQQVSNPRPELKERENLSQTLWSVKEVELGTAFELSFKCVRFANICLSHSLNVTAYDRYIYHGFRLDVIHFWNDDVSICTCMLSRQL